MKLENDKLFKITSNKSTVGRYWILTIPHHEYTPYPNPNVQWLKGQLELAASGYLHWQLVVSFDRNVRLSYVKEHFGSKCHAELSRSAAAESYVHKEETSVGNTRFEFGRKLFKRCSRVDWEGVWDSAIQGTLADVPANVRVQSYRTLKAIQKDHLKPVPTIREVVCFWGETGTGKSRRAWEEASFDAYPKDPRTKFWDGYQGQANVVMDEFRGDIDIAHLLRWFDRYPVVVENKGGSVSLSATKIWITSNLDPRSWFPGLDKDTTNALLRRLSITHFEAPFRK